MHTPPTPQRSRFAGNPASNVRQIVRRFESPAAERRARALGSRSKSTPRGFMNGSNDLHVPLPDYEQDEVIDLRSPRQFKSPSVRSASSTPRPPPHQFQPPEVNYDSRTSRIRSNPRGTPSPSTLRRDIGSPYHTPHESSLNRMDNDTYARPVIDQYTLPRSRSSTNANMNGMNQNGHLNGYSGTLKSSTSNGMNGLQKSKSNGHWVYDSKNESPYSHYPSRLDGDSNGYSSRMEPPTTSMSMISVKDKVVSGSPPATSFVNEPWKLTIRREVFYPGERLDDGDAIDLVFSQIINDCRKNNPHRIRQFERDRINYLLSSFSFILS